MLSEKHWERCCAKIADFADNSFDGLSCGYFYDSRECAKEVFIYDYT